MKRPVVLIIRDGWGKNPYEKWDRANAVKLARHPVADMLMATYPNTLIQTSGFDVGLPEGTMGNSEVGHQNIGAGRVVDQESVAITKAIRDKSFFANVEINACIDTTREHVPMSTANALDTHRMSLIQSSRCRGCFQSASCWRICRQEGERRT